MEKKYLVYQIYQEDIYKANDKNNEERLIKGYMLYEIYTSKEVAEKELNCLNEASEKMKKDPIWKHYFKNELIEKEISDISVIGELSLDSREISFEEEYNEDIFIDDFNFNEIARFFQGKKVKLTLEIIE